MPTPDRYKWRFPYYSMSTCRYCDWMVGGYHRLPFRISWVLNRLHVFIKHRAATRKDGSHE